MSLSLSLFIGLLASLQGFGADPVIPERGYIHRREINSQEPWSIHILQIDRSNTNLALHTTLATSNGIGLAVLNNQLKSLPASLGRPIAAVNGDYYENKNTSKYQGDPKGLQIMRGEVISDPSDWSCFWINAQGHPQMGIVASQFEVIWPDGSKTPIGLNEARVAGGAVLYTSRVGRTTRTSGGRELILEAGGSSPWVPVRAGETYISSVQSVRERGDASFLPHQLVLSISDQLKNKVPRVKRGDIVKISLRTVPDLKGVETAIGGGPALVHEGKAGEWNFGLLDIREALRHPRTAIGWNDQFIFLVQVDGRQSGFSSGMTYAEIAAYMVKLGCTEALNLDGGGSSTMWLLGQVINSPSKGFERGMANALVLLQKEVKKDGLESARISP